MAAIITDEQDQPASVQSRRYDPVVVFVAGSLMTLGAAMVFSATVTARGAGIDLDHLRDSPLKQGMFVVAGFVAMLVTARFDHRNLAWTDRSGGWRVGVPTVLTIGLLVAVLLVGHTAGGARRQIMVPGLPFGFQPSELAKVVLVAWLAAMLTRPPAVGRFWRWLGGLLRCTTEGAPPPGDIRDFLTGFLPTIISCSLMVGLVLVEDYGTAALMGVVMLAMLLVGGARISHIFLAGVFGLLAGVLFIVIEPFRRDRVREFFAEKPDVEEAGYQIHQAMVAIGSGGWWGRGLGAGVQKYGYLPQDNNDFIFAIICEELGVVGGLAVVAMFLVLLWRGWRISAQAPDRFGRLMALGLTLMICLQAAFNVAVVTNSVPTKGISLPFVSSGGSGVIFLGVAAGLLASVGRSSGEAPGRYEDGRGSGRSPR